MTRGQITKWIKEQRQIIIDPDGEGVTIETALEYGALDEGAQAQLQLLDELEVYLETLK